MNNFFKRNLTAKIISVFFALIMWTYVMSDINPKMTREITNVPVQLLNMEELRQQGLVIVGEVNDQIRVTVKGRRDEIYKINKNDVKATADLNGYKAGVNNIPVDVASLGNIEVDYSPKFLKVELEEIVRKQREVDLLISGNPKVGYILNEPRYKPSVVWIEGPASFVNAVDRVVAKLELNKGEVEEIVASLPLKALDDKDVEVMNVEIKPPYIDVYLPVDRLRTIRIEPKIEAKAAEGYRITDISVLPESIALRGQEELISSLSSVATEAVKLDNLTENKTIDASLVLPEGIKLFNEEEVKITVVVEAIVEKILDVPTVNIEFTGIQQGLDVDYDALLEKIQVKLVGKESVLQQINIEDIKMMVDLKNLNSGTHDVIVNASISTVAGGGIDEVTTTPKKISVKLIEPIQRNND